MDRQTLAEQVRSIPWFHRIDLGHGIITPGDDNTPAKLRDIGLPQDLTGMSVLDIGAWDGFFSFEAERRGAQPVVAADGYVWTLPGRKAGFDLAKSALQSRVEERIITVEEMSPAAIGTFDLVLFLGVLYHLRHPFLGLERVASVTNKMCIIETYIDLVDVPRPAAAFYPGAILNNDATNWWGPNPQCVIEMCKEVGFREVKALKATYVPSRMVFHAFK